MTMGRGMLRSAVVLVIGIASIGLDAPVSAFWRIWQKEGPLKTKEKPPVCCIKLKEVRDSGCGRPDAVQVFGENAFMRREAERRGLPEDVSRAIAGAYMAETTRKAYGILSPHLDAPEATVRDAARLSYAFVVLSRSGLDVGGADAARLAALLREPFTRPLEADRHYLLAVMALADRNWPRVAAASRKAIELSPKYYNAHVLHSLAQLGMIGAGSLSASQCEATLVRIEELLMPLLSLGACPMHVAHLDLVAERYLPAATDRVAEKLRLIRRIYLAYVSRNDKLGRELVADYRKTFGLDGCIGRLSGLDFRAHTLPGDR
jgi:hypothetical protein